MTINAVVFDVGGTLVDETRLFDGWADWLRVDRMEFYAALGASIQARQHHRRVFEMVAPGADIAALRAARQAAGAEFVIEPRDLYADAAPCIAACKAAGLFVGIAGNQPERAEAALHACGLGADMVAASDRWGVAKPDPRFFDRVVAECGVPADQIAYVGDRVDNDVVPARAAGMLPVFLARGPWGVVQAGWPEAAQAGLVLRSLDGLAAALTPRTAA